MQRRTFVKNAAGAVAAGATAFAVGNRVIGANDRVRVAVLGINGRGRDHIKGFEPQKNVEVATLCDPDLSLARKRAGEFQQTYGRKPKVVQDLRDVFADKDIDVVGVATPNHWHALAAIWACEAGKDVYIEKPGTHNISEGRKLIAAAKKHNRIVQHGVQLRSNPAIQEAVQKLREGVIGDVYMGRALIYKWRPSVGKKPDGAPPADLDWNLWQGPAQERKFSERYVHYN
ncbi:MAG: Gfo/Idh/MocA family oxidoreductase, partial [bacterium]|nr:Gfo/Idh/MocA family oxidoreductase [bacterium]